MPFALSPHASIRNRINNALQRAQYAFNHYFTHHSYWSPAQATEVTDLFHATEDAVMMTRLSLDMGDVGDALQGAGWTEYLSDRTGKVAGVIQNDRYDAAVERRAQAQLTRWRNSHRNWPRARNYLGQYI